MKLGGRKLIILRRAHALSLPAAIRVRAILQQYVLPANGTGMIWITAREMSGSLSLLEDAFVRVRIPRMPYGAWCSAVDAAFHTVEAYDRLEGRPERAAKMLEMGAGGTAAPPAYPRRISDYYDEFVAAIITGAKKTGAIAVIPWIRARVYDVLAFCQNGIEIIDSTAAAFARAAPLLEPDQFWKGMQVLATSEPHTSYRTPLAIEYAFLELFDVIQSSKKTPVRSKDVEVVERTLSIAGGAAAPAPAPASTARGGRGKACKPK